MIAHGDAAAYGGPGWTPRTRSLGSELGTVWADCGVASETGPLEAVLLHRPGPELDVADADAALMLERPKPDRGAAEHDSIAEAFRSSGIIVHYVVPHPSPSGAPLPPNLMFVADLLFLTPEGAILGRPASRARAGEERWVARRLAELGIPILRSVRGTATFEGADAAWLDERNVLLARGLRTNDEGAAQVAATLNEMGVDVAITELSRGTMHLMGQLRFLDRDLAVVRRDRVGASAIVALEASGYDVLDFPDADEMDRGFAHNFVTLGPRSVLMPADRPVTQAFYESLGVRCRTVRLEELHKAAGGIGCLTGILKRASDGPAPTGTNGSG